MEYLCIMDAIYAFYISIHNSYSIVNDDVIIMTSSLTIDPHGLRLKESTEDSRFEKLNYCLQHSMFENQFNLQRLHFEEMIIEVRSIFNLLVANKLIIKCNIQLSIYIC